MYSAWQDHSNFIFFFNDARRSLVYQSPYCFRCGVIAKWCFKISFTVAAAAKSLQSCPTLCDPIDGSPPGSPIPGILQARTLEWVAISFSNAWKWKVKVKSLSRVWLFVTPRTAAYQAPPSMGFSRQEYWSGVPLPSPKMSFENCPERGGHILWVNCILSHCESRLERWRQ